MNRFIAERAVLSYKLNLKLKLKLKLTYKLDLHA